MTKTACLYAIVRFMPYIETGEFANAGILMIAPSARYFGYKLLKLRYGRITHFFEELDSNVFKSTIATLAEELKRVDDLLKQNGFDRRHKVNDIQFARNIFAEIIRPRETILRFSEPRAALSEDPKKTLKELFSHYVDREFVTKEYRQKSLERGVSLMLSKAKINERFIPQKLGDPEYQVIFPFVEMQNDQPTKVIKPLHLNQDESFKIIEHGGKWEFRIRELRKRHILQPENVLFAVDGPNEKSTRVEAYNEVIDMLKGIGSRVLPYSNTEEIISFAQEGRPPNDLHCH